MVRKPPRGLFITGTDTNVGKTYIACAILRKLVRQGHRVGAYKPVASGCRQEDGHIVSDDALALWNAAGQPADPVSICPQCFIAPLAPHLAARAEGKSVNAELLREGLEFWADRAEIVVVEGVGGLMSPLTETDYVADLAEELDYPLIVVAANRLGIINLTLQTLITAETFRAGIPVAGIVLNETCAPDQLDPSASSNADELRARCVPPLLAHVSFGQTKLPEHVNWFELARPRPNGP